MSSTNFNVSTLGTHGGCGGGGGTAPLPRPRLNPDGTVFGGFNFPDFDGSALPEPEPFGGERFVTSPGGGFIIGKDGNLAGRIPANAYVDTKTGKVYGPDDKAIEIPEGANVDFRDLPDLKTILEMVKATDGGGDGEITGERFISSEAGGLIIGKDGNVAGRVPAGSFLDAKDGKVYGPDSKPITVPEGGTVDFFDLPSIDQIMKDVRSGGGAAAKGAKAVPAWDYAFPQTMVDGQWGPGGVTSFKGGAAGSLVGGMHGAGEDCGMDHGGPSSTKAGGPGSANPGVPAQLQRMLEQQLAQLNGGYGPFSAGAFRPVLGGGPGTAVAGARGLGSLPSLDFSLRELVLTLNELTAALAKTTGGGNASQTGTQTSTQSSGSTSTSSGTTSTSTDSGSSSSSSTTTSSGSGSGSSSSSSSTST
jgi:hypothetical protein